MKLLTTAFAFLVLATASHAQAPAVQETLPAIKVDIKRVTVAEQPTPQFSAGNVREKRWRPKNWVEVDIEFDVKLPVSAGGNKGTYDSLQMAIYVALQHTTTDGKFEVVEGTLDLVSIPAGENHALAYISPATMKSVFQKDVVTVSSDVKGWGVEVFAEGKRIAGDTNLGKGPWWEEKKDSFAFLQGMLLSKAQTPFSILWGDYDVPVKAK
ncbi:Amuc_1102 family pilus-like protein [Prosthecobacter sp.]|uniref:Amuc_1102 family pilus-like protein n=1 Tax=Prosthecobacter sp. TaxID=1965333 RepID=UPI001DF7186E|nr:Amuc_1102 family pilus-like protein [Prosthecobacter sp.]MCB1276662.1 hypothetical protein [Prosthecobacter sp.]